MRDKWTVLFVGRDTGLIAEYGNKWIGHPEHYPRVDVVSKGNFDKAESRIKQLEHDLRRYKARYNALEEAFDLQDAEVVRLRYALNAMVCFFGMDEDSESKTVFDVARAALSGVEGN